MTEMSQRKKPR